MNAFGTIKALRELPGAVDGLAAQADRTRRTAQLKAEDLADVGQRVASGLDSLSLSVSLLAVVLMVVWVCSD